MQAEKVHLYMYFFFFFYVCIHFTVSYSYKSVYDVGEKEKRNGKEEYSNLISFYALLLLLKMVSILAQRPRIE